MSRRTLALLLLLAAPAAAQARPEEAWRDEVERLLSRWSDDAGSSRLKRARGLLAERTTKQPNDAAAHMELARIELAADEPRAALACAERAAALWSDEEARERAARTLEEKARRPGDPAPAPPGPELVERRARALAVAYLAQLRSALDDARQRPDEAQARAHLDSLEAQIARRRKALHDAAGDQAGKLVKEETARREALRNLDALGAPPRPISAEDAAGGAVDLTKYRGKVLIIIFWSKEVVDCAEQLLAVDAVWRELKDQGLEALGVCLDAPNGAAAQLVAEKGIAWRQVWGGQGLLSKDARAWEVRSLPTGVLVDADGRVRFVDPWSGDLELSCRELLDRAAELAKSREPGFR